MLLRRSPSPVALCTEVVVPLGPRFLPSPPPAVPWCSAPQLAPLVGGHVAVASLPVWVAWLGLPVCLKPPTLHFAGADCGSLASFLECLESLVARAPVGWVCWSVSR